MASVTSILLAQVAPFLPILVLSGWPLPANDELPVQQKSPPKGLAQAVQTLVQPTVDAASSVLRPQPRLLSVDRRVGHPEIDYLDPEFWAPQRRMAWQDRDNNIWLCELDPQTGELLPMDGRGQKLGVAATLIGGRIWSLPTGVEWGISQRGLAVYFLMEAENRKLFVARVALADGSMEMVTSLTQSASIGVFPSQDADDPQARVMFALRPQQPLSAVAYWQEETDPSSIHRFPIAAPGTSGPRWIPGARAIVTNAVDADGIPQIARYDIDTDVTTILTDGPGEKVDGFFFHAPEAGNELQFICVIDYAKIGVFREQNGTWMQVRQIAPPPIAGSSDTKVVSTEPFVYRGKSYVSYGTRSEGQTAICVAAADGSVNGFVSAPSPLEKIDPEAIVLDDRLWIYYWINDAEPKELHACRVQITP